MSGSIVREALWRVTVWGVQHRLAQLRRLLPPFGRSRDTGTVKVETSREK